MKGIGIIGLGSTVAIANFHEKGISRDGRVKISAVYDIDFENAKRWVAERKLDCHIAGSVEELFEHCDAVDICTPNFTHCDYVIKALDANKHVFVEKPPSLDASEAKRELLALGDKRLVNMVGYIYRFNNATRMLKKLIETRIGRIFTYTTYYGGKRLADPTIPLEWRFVRALSGSGAIADFGSHVVDTARFLMGERITSVSAVKNTFITERKQNSRGQTKVENDDACAFSATMESGALLSATVSRVGMDDMRIVVAGEGGMASLTMRHADEILFWEKQRDGAYSEKLERLEVPKQVYFDGWFEVEMKEFIDALLGENDDYPTLNDGYYVQRVLECVEEAADLGKTVII